MGSPPDGGNTLSGRERREEWFLRAQCKDTGAGLNEVWMSRFALFALKWLEGIPRGSYQND